MSKKDDLVVKHYGALIIVAAFVGCISFLLFFGLGCLFLSLQQSFGCGLIGFVIAFSVIYISSVNFVSERIEEELNQEE